MRLGPRAAIHRMQDGRRGNSAAFFMTRRSAKAAQNVEVSGPPRGSCNPLDRSPRTRLLPGTQYARGAVLVFSLFRWASGRTVLIRVAVMFGGFL